MTNTQDKQIMTQDFPLSKTGYLAFDPLTMKSYLRQRLIDNGVLTDQIYEGSNTTQVIDMLAYTFHTLIYYLNKTGPEALFTDAKLYENMNRIVKMLGYNPVGRQTSILPFKAYIGEYASIADKVYTLPRYSYINIGSVAYTFNTDCFLNLVANLTGSTYLEEFSNTNLLYQGIWKEHKKYTAIGDINETVILNIGSNAIVDHFNIHVYVKDIFTGDWTAFNRVTSLYTSGAFDKDVEIRFSDQKHYEIKFGDGINGLKLKEGDIVALYYLESNGKDGEVGISAIDNSKIKLFKTDQFSEIVSDIIDPDGNAIEEEILGQITFFNESASTYYTPEEDVEDIRKNAPNVFKSQTALVTASNFETYIKMNFRNFISDVKCVNNWGYLSGQIKYLHERGLTNPLNDGRVCFNQVMYADSCNFNNVYIYVVPKSVVNETQPVQFVNPSLKNAILDAINNNANKILTVEPVLLDPVYKIFDIGIEVDGVFTVADASDCELYVIKKKDSRRDSSVIKNDIANLVLDYFSRDNCTLGQTTQISYLSNLILAVDGVEEFYTRRKSDVSNNYKGLSVAAWNPIYTNDISVDTRDFTLENFQFPAWNNPADILNKITIKSSTFDSERMEY